MAGVGTLALAALLCLWGVPSEGAITDDLVTDLPGLTFEPTFKSYSGYLKATGTRKLHYWFTESSGDPASAPLVLWLNGGPGCSSLDGLLSEHGPFRASEDGQTVTQNKYSWNTVANMLYMEAPAGVGYSYADDKNYTTSDDQVALDNHWALKYFLKYFPEYAKNEFYITGESYGGVYIPTLAARIMDDKTFNFKGFAVGNGLSSYEINGNSLLYFMYYHGLIGSGVWTEMVAKCCQGTQDANRCNFVGNPSEDCQNLVNVARGGLDGLNIYNLYSECYTQQQQKSTNNTSLNWLFDPRTIYHKKPDSEFEARKMKISSMPHESAGEVPPCIDATGITKYLNRKDVRKALHIPSSLPTWAICSSEVGAKYVRQYMTMVDVYKKILAAQKYRILIYNGDIDMACNFLGDQWFFDSLGLKLVKLMKSWTYKEQDGSRQVAGFYKVYDQKVVFTTIRGAGHMVPQDKPIPALNMFTAFLKGENF